MKTSIFATAATLLFAAFVAATPAPINDLATTSNTLEPRCESCNEACPKTHFYYAPKKCCLQIGGPKNPPNPPKDRDCPKYWYWNGDTTCCTPRYPQPSSTKPTCGTSTFSWWDKDNQCCKKPATRIRARGTNPPGTSHRPRRNIHQPKSKYTGRKAEIKNRQASQCPSSWQICPIGTRIECLDSYLEIHACGGCPAYGVGQDCTAIPNSMNVECQATGQTPSCVEMDRERFKTMWAVSENEAEGCFLRLPQVEFYAEQEDRVSVEEYGDV
ncbi:hypothetical protein FRC04_002618 [Tulasnella sp. 424]|nr:hypothetical protein FRC04_002618 [Tulasnella sp. 424]KAG8976833.1 hypothetical protein FRC05_003183 [Tulasnella sp. 425]